ncbi:hypothetical protein MMC30_004939 [Trapelia coarctata]|nr:hypothetical protein [Trapelia coarctata]
MRITSKPQTRVYTAKPDEGMELAVVPWQPPSTQDANFDVAMVPPYDLDMKIDNQPLVQHSFPARENCSRYCALRKLAFDISSPSDLSRYSPELRQGLFLDWAYQRVYDGGILRQERFTCPLLWCRRLFDNPRMLLKHIESCDRLAEGEYWCYEHAGPERFAPLATRQKSNLKLSNCIRHAVRIIRKLGSRRLKHTVEAAELAAEHDSPRRLQPSPATDYVFVPAEKKTTAMNRLDAELSTLSCEVKELPTTHSRFYEHQSSLPMSDAPGLPVFPPDDMEIDKSDTSSSASCRSISPIQEGYHVVDENPLSPMTPCCDASPRTRRFHFEEMGMDHASTSRVSFPSHTPQIYLDDPLIAGASVETIPIPATLYLDVHMTSDFTDHPDHHKAAETMNTREIPVPPMVYSDEKIICAMDYDSHHHGQASGNYIPARFTEQHTQFMIEDVREQQTPFGTETQMRTQLELVEGLRRVSAILYKRSVRNLQRDRLTADIRSFMRNMPPSELIAEKGLAALRKFFAGSLPSTIMEIYAMLHVAYVAAIVINQIEVVEVQNDLYADILNWSLAIKSVRERALFGDIARRMWASDYSKLNCPRQATEYASGALNQPCFTTVLPAMGDTPRSSMSGSGKSKSFAPSRDNVDQATTLFHNLKNGTAIYLCRQYLDVLEYTGLLSGPRGPYLRQLQGCSTTIVSREESTTASHWENKITTPLITFMGLEGFRSIIINVQKLMANGVFHNLREVELKLIYDGQHCSRSPARYHSFLKEVRRLCKEASTFPLHQPFSHDTQYMRDIDVTWRFLHALNQKSAALAPSPIAKGCTSNSGRMTNKDLPRLETDARIISISSDSSIATSSSSASAHTVPSAFGGETVFSHNSAASSSSSYSLIPTPRKGNDHSPSNLSPFSLSPFNSTPSNSASSNSSPSNPRATPSVPNLSPGFAPPSTPAPRRPSRTSSSGPPSGGTSYCPQCNEPFTGNFHKTNLKRHLKSVHDGKRLPCPFGVCRETFTRSDNLRTHQKKFGHW